MPRPIPAVAAAPLVSPTPAGVAARMQVEQRRAGGAERRAGGEALDGARREQPGCRVGEREQDGCGDKPAKRDEQDRPAADVVGHAPDEQQAGQHPERVGRVDQGQRQRREVPQHAVGVIQRRRRDRGEQAEPDHARNKRVRDPVRQDAPPLDRRRDGVERRLRLTFGSSLQSLHRSLLVSCVTKLT